MLDFPGMVDAQPIGQLDLVERVLKQLELPAFVPRPRELMLVEDAESHVSPSGSPVLTSGCWPGQPTRARLPREYINRRARPPACGPSCARPDGAGGSVQRVPARNCRGASSEWGARHRVRGFAGSPAMIPA